jgi:hypothetical protein
MGEGDAISRQIHVALWETGGESIEGAFVDRYESFSDQAIDELLEAGFGIQMSNETIAALSDPALDLAKAAHFVYRIGRDHPEFPSSLLDSPNPQIREVYFRAVGKLPGTVDWRRGLVDPADKVRAAAILSMGSRVPAIPEAESAKLAALGDPSPLVRRTAVAGIDFFRNPVGSDVLADVIEKDVDRSVVERAILHIADVVSRAGISLDTSRVLEGLDDRLKHHLISALSDDNPSVRDAAARALHRLQEPETARAMLARLDLEQNHTVRGTLLLYPGFATVPDAAFPVLARLATGGDDLARVRSSFLLESFGQRAIEPLRLALKHPHSHRAAAMSLGKVGDLACLPSLVRSLWEAADTWLQRDLESAATSVAITAAHRDAMPGANPEPILQALIDAQPARSFQNYPQGAVREAFNALPILGDAFETWSIRADGKVICTDHESVRMETEVVEDPLKVFAVYLHAATQYPEIEPLLPQPPKSARLCRYCLGTGLSGDEVCSRCGRFGWVRKDY